MTAEEDNTVEPQEGLGLPMWRNLAPRVNKVTLDPNLAVAPEGRYLAELVELPVHRGPSDHPYYRATFELLEPEGYVGVRVSTVISFHPNALRWTVRRLETIAGQEIPRTEVDLEDYDFTRLFLNRRVYLTVEHSESHIKGEFVVRAEVTAIEEAPQPPPPPWSSRPKPTLFAEPETPPAEAKKSKKGAPAHD
jgi:hypothetical protein